MQAELGLYPLVNNIQKIGVKLYNQLKWSDAYTFHHKALTYIEMNPEKSALKYITLFLFIHSYIKILSSLIYLFAACETS